MRVGELVGFRIGDVVSERSRYYLRRRLAKTLLDVSPARLQLVKTIPSGMGWLYEPKLDGYRGLISRDSRGRPSVLSRNGKDLGRFFPEMAGLAEQLAPGTVIDGEIVSPAENGVSFIALQQRLMTPASQRARNAAQSPVAMLAFDLLHDHESDLRKLSLKLRRRKLDAIVETVGSSLLQLVTQTDNPLIASQWLDERVTMAGIEGVVAKRDEPYPRPNVKRWQKVRRLSTIEVDVHGFIGAPESPRLVVALRGSDRSRVAGTTLPLQPDDAARIAAVAPLAILAERPVWPRFDNGAPQDWFRVPSGLVAEVAYSHLDGASFRQSVRFLRWRSRNPPESA